MTRRASYPQKTTGESIEFKKSKAQTQKKGSGSAGLGFVLVFAVKFVPARDMILAYNWRASLIWSSISRYSRTNRSLHPRMWAVFWEFIPSARQCLTLSY